MLWRIMIQAKVLSSLCTYNEHLKMWCSKMNKQILTKIIMHTNAHTHSVHRCRRAKWVTAFRKETKSHEKY